LTRLLLILGAYLLGSIPFGLLVGRLGGGIDVRGEGSGNIGATNVSRSLGLGAGILTLTLDLGKGAVAVALARWVDGSAAGPVLAGLAALVGHIFPVYLHFRGGKGVATGCGVFLLLAPAATLCAATLFGLTVLVTRRVSPGSILAAASLPLILVLENSAPILVAASLIASILIILRHKKNIQNLLSGIEPRVGEQGRGR